MITRINDYEGELLSGKERGLRYFFVFDPPCHFIGADTHVISVGLDDIKYETIYGHLNFFRDDGKKDFVLFEFPERTVMVGDEEPQ